MFGMPQHVEYCAYVANHPPEKAEQLSVHLERTCQVAKEMRKKCVANNSDVSVRITKLTKAINENEDTATSVMHKRDYVADGAS